MKDTDSRPELQLEVASPFVPFPELTWVRGGISLRSDGGMSWDNNSEATVAVRREDYFTRLRLNISSCVAADQIHGTCVHATSRADRGRGISDKITRIPGTDGFVTDEPGLVLTTLHADCAPVYFVNLLTKRIGLAHCGWRGTLAGLPGIMLQNMMNGAAGAVDSVRVAIGPTISTRNYEFSGHESMLFKQRFGPTVTMRLGGKEHLDLVSAIVISLLESGLKVSTIPPRPPCTFCDLQYASYRRDGSPTRSMMAWLTRDK